MKEIHENYYTIEDVSTFMGLTPKALKNRVCSGKDHPPVIKLNWTFRKDAFHKWMKEQETHQLN